MGRSYNDASSFFHAKKALSMKLLHPIRAEAFMAVESGLAGNENIVGVGIDKKMKDHELISESCLKVFVKQKFPEDKISKNFMIPKTFEGIKTDVEEIGEVFAQAFTNCYDPIDGGSSIGHINITAGTLGCFVKKTDGEMFILSNNHVLANSNNALRGDLIVQPGPIDGGVHDSITHPGDCDLEDKCVGKLSNFEPIDFMGNPNQIDAAIAKPFVKQRRNLSNEIKQIGILNGHTTAVDDEKVRKSGRTTEFTSGKISSLDFDVTVNYGVGNALFESQIVIRGSGDTFSMGGDSGSIIVNESNKAVGLLFAGNSNVTFANHVVLVLNRFGVAIA